MMKGRRFTRPDIITSNITREESAKEVVQVMSEEIVNPGLDLIDVSAAVVRLAHLQDSLTPDVLQDPHLTLLVSMVRSKLRIVAKRGGVTGARQCSNIFWAVAKLDSQKLAALSVLRCPSLQPVKATVAEMDAQGIANVIWALTNLRVEQTDMQELLTAAAQRLDSVADAFIPQGISNVLWASATLHSDATVLLHKMPLLVKAATRLLPSMSSQDVCEVLGACAKLKDQTELLNLLPSLVSMANDLSSDMRPFHLCNIVSYAAELREISPELMKLVPTLIRLFANVSPADVRPDQVAIVLHALAKLRQEIPQLGEDISAVIKMASDVPGKLSAESCATCLRDLGMLGVQQSAAAQFLQQLCKRARSAASAIDSQGIANACLGLAMSNWKAGRGAGGFLSTAFPLCSDLFALSWSSTCIGLYHTPFLGYTKKGVWYEPTV